MCYSKRYANPMSYFCFCLGCLGCEVIFLLLGLILCVTSCQLRKLFLLCGSLPPRQLSRCYFVKAVHSVWKWTSFWVVWWVDLSSLELSACMIMKYMHLFHECNKACLRDFCTVVHACAAIFKRCVQKSVIEPHCTQQPLHIHEQQQNNIYMFRNVLPC